MKLTPHEEKILNIINKNPGIVDQPALRSKVAKKYGLTEKTLRNRIAELRKRGLLSNKPKLKPSQKKSLITENDEININLIWEIINKNKKFIFKFSFLTTFLGLIYSLLATVYFTSRISLYPAGELNSQGGALGEFQGLAKSFGLGSLGSAPTYNIPDIIDSRRLKKDIILKTWNTSEFPTGTNLITFWEIDKPSIFSPISTLRNLLPGSNTSINMLDKHLHDAILVIDDLINVKEEISGLISVTVSMQDPILASDIANYIAEYVKNFISAEQKIEASRNRLFIEEQMKEAKFQNEKSEDRLTEFRKKNPLRLDTPSIEMKRERLESAVVENREVYITLRQQFEIAKIDEAKEKLLINILDTAEPAVKKTRPKRTLIVVLSFFAGLLLSIPFAIYFDRKNN